MAGARHSPGAYSRFVGALKILLPLLAVLILSTVFLSQKEDTFEGGLVFSKADRATLGDGLTIRDPNFSGSNKAGDRFSISAEAATPDAAQPRNIAMVRPVARTNFNSGLVVTLTAAEGHADIDAQTVTLEGGLRIVTSDGYELNSAGGIAYLRPGIVTTTGPVVANGPAGHVEAGKMTIARAPQGDQNTALENRFLTFNNGVKMIITPQTTGSPE